MLIEVYLGAYQDAAIVDVSARRKSLFWDLIWAWWVSFLVYFQMGLGLDSFDLFNCIGDHGAWTVKLFNFILLAGI